MSPPVFPDRQGDIYNGEEGGENKDNEKKIDREELQKADFADGRQADDGRTQQHAHYQHTDHQVSDTLIEILFKVVDLPVQVFRFQTQVELTAL